MSFLADPRLQGIGALAAVVAVVVMLTDESDSAARDGADPVTPVNDSRSFLSDPPRPEPGPSQVAPVPTQPRRSAPTESRAAPTAPPASPARTAGLQLEVSGFGAADALLRTQLLAELGGREWTRSAAASGATLRITGSIRDAAHTVGQIPTAAASASWELTDVEGRPLDLGGVPERLGTGLDSSEARAATVELIARAIADNLNPELP
jgi:hypothetical protein